MAYVQYTHCTDQYDGACGPWPTLWYALGHGLVGAFLGSALGVLLSIAFGPAGFIWGVFYGFGYGFFSGVCDRYEYHRLLCIEHDECAVGRVGFQEPPSAKQGFDAIDNDYSLNLVLTPHFETDDMQTIVTDGLQGEHFIRRRFPDLGYQGYVDVPNEYLNRFPVDEQARVLDGAGGHWSLHCEFEGSRMHSICSWGQALAPVAALAAVGAWLACGDGLWGLICAFFAWLAVELGAFGIGWATGNDGSPADAAVDPASGTLEDGDCIAVFGDFVYDVGHCEGWHEIHPVKYVQKIPPLAGDPDRPSPPVSRCLQGDLSDPNVRTQADDLINTWCAHLQQAHDDGVLAAQRNPENQWHLHPDIDGCEPPVVVG
jgi:hypothetical protein